MNRLIGRIIVFLLFAQAAAISAMGQVDMSQRTIKVGIMLPLNKNSSEGIRMVEYYRGVLMACDSLRQMGVSTDIRAWDVRESTDVDAILKEDGVSDLDLIIGPLYAKHLNTIGDFATEHDIRVVVPFTINAAEQYPDLHIYQLYQTPKDFNEGVVRRYVENFSNYHTVFIDCNDETSKKGVFTLPLRDKLTEFGLSFRITNVKSSDEAFAKSFSKTQPNMVVINTGRSQDLNLVLARLNNVTANDTAMQVSMFGYPEWMSYTQQYLDDYYRYNAYIPSTFFYNPLSAKTARFLQKFRWNFHADLQGALPRFGIAGFDHAFFFIRGIHLYGDVFKGKAAGVGYTAIQNPLDFDTNGETGYKNKGLLFVNYTSANKVEIIRY